MIFLRHGKLISEPILKNYDSEIEEFLDWLEPYIGTEGFIGYMRYEEWEDPTLHMKLVVFLVWN